MTTAAEELRAEEMKALDELIEREPDFYGERMFNVKHTPQQIRILRTGAVEKNLIVPSGNGTGKTFTLAEFVWWWERIPYSRTVITSSRWSH